MTTSVTIGRPGQFQEFERHCEKRVEQALLRASSRAARQATTDVRGAMRSAGLGRLGNAIGTGSDLAKGGNVHRSANGFSASGWLHIRGRSERTRGAIEAYTEGAQISPRAGKWLAIATAQIPAKVGRRKMTPELYRTSGYEEKLGPLVFIQRSPSEALLIVENVSVDTFGRIGRRARKLPKQALRKGRRRADFIVAFVLIRRSSRAARVAPRSIVAAAAAKLPALIGEELRKEL